ncbi:hypothetical protein ABPG72_002904 [Tetrahymena utriculariae]
MSESKNIQAQQMDSQKETAPNLQADYKKAENYQNVQEQVNFKEEKISVTTKEIAKLKKELFYDVAKSIYDNSYQNSRIDQDIYEKCKKIVYTNYFMQGSLAVSIAYFAGKILFQKRQRYTKNNLDTMFIMLLFLSAGGSGISYNSKINNLQQYFMWENGKFKNINIVEYKKDPTNYVKYLLEE